MLRPLLALLFVIAACSGSRGTATHAGGEAGSAGSGDPLYPKRVFLSWGIEGSGKSSNVFLQTTDETGKQVSHPVGTFAGLCATTQPAPEMKAIIAVACKDGATGVEIHAIAADAEVIILKMRIDDGVTPDPMAREEVTRVKVPLGAALSAGS